ncbi:MAG: alpha-L-rhamnosidase N-terminal domain-containing protein, partial [Bryobacteraceae bacterium]
MQRRTFLLQTAALALARAAEIDVRRQGWTARWIHPPVPDLQRYGVFHFRRALEFASAPAKCLVHVTADSRYQLYVNGRRVVWGPARGDLFHWRYETIDLAPYLQPGRNVIAAIVWNDGPHAAIAQWSFRTGFLLQAVDTEHARLNTGPGWRCLESAAYQPVPVPNYQPTGYYAIGPMERVDAARYPWGWQQPDFDDGAWPEARVGLVASSREHRDAPTRWMLVPRPIPLMEERPERLARLRRAEGVQPPEQFPSKPARVTVPPRSRASMLLDQGYLTCAFPELEVEGGRGAAITLRYAEALWQQLKPRRMKGHRDEVEGKEFIGYGDTFLADGGRRLYRPLYWRTYRYMLVEIETQDEPLDIVDLRATATGYPFEVKARFDSPDPLHRKILETGWRTARLCAHETYMDCPYYEQLQYVGDTRIQALVSIYMTGDARLMRNAIEQIDASRTHEGATFSRAPSTLQQYIPPFSLWWIGMVHDYWRYVDDAAFVREMLGGVRAVLGFYERYQRADGLLGPMPWWNYVDWVEGWQAGCPPSEPDVMPASIHMQWLLALQHATELEEVFQLVLNKTDD